MNEELIRRLKERRDALKASVAALVAPVDDKGEIRSLTEAEDVEFKSVAAEIRSLDERVEELRAADVREAAALAANPPAGATVTVVNEPNPHYRKNDSTSASYFRDIASAKLGWADASEARGRLRSSQETRAGDMTTVAGAGGEFAPPAWLISDFIAVARGGRVTADLCNKQPLPSGVNGINLPKGSTGTTTAVQALQNSALSDTAMTTTSVSSGITTVGGKQIISMQLLQQSGIPFDAVILADLAADYALSVDKQVLYGTNANGQVLGLVGAATNSAFTSATPAPASVTNANSLYYTLTKAAAKIQRGMFKPATAVVMSPERWAWILGSVDANARPYVIPDGGNFNPTGTTGEQVAQGAAGTFGSYKVYTDPNVSQTANSATNQDEIYIIRGEELWLFESAPRFESFEQTYADNASVLFRALGYMAFIPNRYASAVQSLRGTGLVVP